MTAARRQTWETAVGVLMTVILFGFIAFAYTRAQLAPEGGFIVSARFDQADGITPGSPVWLSGIPVGAVVEQYLDEHSRAVLVMRLDDGLELDSETSAAVVTDGLFGDKLVQLEIGGGETMIAPGGEIAYTESTIVIDDLMEMILQRARANTDTPAP